MAKTRREFKREAVALLESSGRMQIAAELWIQPSMLRNWRTASNVAVSRPRPGASPRTSVAASPSDQAVEIARLRRELDRTRMERDVKEKRSASGHSRAGGSGRARPTAAMTCRSLRTSTKVRSAHRLQLMTVWHNLWMRCGSASTRICRRCAAWTCASLWSNGKRLRS